MQQKIRNQAFVLAQTKQLDMAEKLQNLAKRVKSGDKENLEAQAALIYFQTTFGSDFRRWQENAINAHLNYAYTVLRSAIARSLVLYGWLPTLGLFHHSELNPFNLADDMIEPFRPLVDLMVWELWQDDKLADSLTPHTKQKLVGLLHYQMRFQDQTFSTLAAIDRTIGSLQNAISQKDPSLLKLPEILPLKEHQYE